VRKFNLGAVGKYCLNGRCPRTQGADRDTTIMWMGAEDRVWIVMTSVNNSGKFCFGNG
jgi:hypothetical protein